MAETHDGYLLIAGPMRDEPVANARRPHVDAVGDERKEAEKQGLKLYEFEILNTLVQNHGQTLSLGKLLTDVWGYAPDDDVETIRVHVRHLRSKLEKVSPERQYIETIYGGGYRLLPEGKEKRK